MGSAVPVGTHQQGPLTAPDLVRGWGQKQGWRLVSYGITGAGPGVLAGLKWAPGPRGRVLGGLGEAALNYGCPYGHDILWPLGFFHSAYFDFFFSNMLRNYIFLWLKNAQEE